MFRKLSLGSRENYRVEIENKEQLKQEEKKEEINPEEIKQEDKKEETKNIDEKDKIIDILNKAKQKSSCSGGFLPISFRRKSHKVRYTRDTPSLPRCRCT